MFKTWVFPASEDHKVIETHCYFKTWQAGLKTLGILSSEVKLVMDKEPSELCVS